MKDISQKKIDVFMSKYMKIENKAKHSLRDRNIKMYDNCNSKLNAIRMTLTMLGIHIEGIN